MAEKLEMEQVGQIISQINTFTLNKKAGLTDLAFCCLELEDNELPVRALETKPINSINLGTPKN